MYTKEKAIQYLQEQVGEHQQVLLDYWTDEDFRGQAEEMDLSLTDKQVGEAMQFVEDNIEATGGVNWNAIEEAIKAVVKGE